MIDVWLLLDTFIKSGRPSRIRLNKSPVATPNGKNTMTSLAVDGKTLSYRKRGMMDVWLILNTVIESRSPFQIPLQ